MISQDKKSLEILGFFSVFPACAGVSLLQSHIANIAERFPRVCGGEPICVRARGGQNEFSPRVRG